MGHRTTARDGWQKPPLSLTFGRKENIVDLNVDRVYSHQPVSISVGDEVTGLLLCEGVIIGADFEENSITLEVTVPALYVSKAAELADADDGFQKCSKCGLILSATAEGCPHCGPFHI
jgi:hypothetical protein